MAASEMRAMVMARSPGGLELRQVAVPAPGDGQILGAVWAGDSLRRPPEELDAAIVFAPIGALVPLALERWRI